MRTRRRRVSVGESGNDVAQVLALSLFIMLLAFFIVLNAISTFEETKIRPTIDSIGNAFATKIMSEGDDRPAMRESTAQALGEGSVLDRLEALFNAQIPGFEAVTNNTRGEMHVRVPYEILESAIFSIGGESGQEDSDEQGKFRAFFLPALIALLSSSEDGFAYRMDMLVNISDNPARFQNEKPEDMARMMKRLGLMGYYLETAGLPKKLMSIGIQNGRKNDVEILFRKHIPYSPVEKDNIPEKAKNNG